MDLKIVSPLDHPDWDDLLPRSGDPSFFHTSAWARVLAGSYGYKPVYFVHRESGRLSLVMPFMDIASPFTGRRGVSLPFTDFCDPFGPDAEALEAAVEAVLAYGRQAKWRYADWRTRGDLIPKARPSATLLTHDLDLRPTEAEILSGMSESHSRNIRKAIKDGLAISIDRSRESLDDFYRLHGLTRRKHGLPPQPLLFFRSILDHVLSRDLGVIVSARLAGKVIASSVFFHFGPTAIFKYGGSDPGQLSHRPNNLVLWEAIRWYKARGATTLNLGRTDVGDEGLRRFKLAWGAVESALSYARYDLGRGAFSPSRLRGERPNRLVSMAPVGILRLAGRMCYRHFG